MKHLANFISIIFHPLFILVYILGFVLIFNPYILQVQDEKARVTFFVYSFVSIIVMPAIAILILKQVNMIKSFGMKDRMERIGPLIIVSILYFWLYINFKNSTTVPIIFTIFTLGSVISVFVSFFINNFTKISLHTVGMGGLVSSLIIMKYQFNLNLFDINILILGRYEVNTYFILLIAIVFAGLVGTSRLYLDSHTKDQIYMGYLVGFMAQIFAFGIVM